MKKSILFCLFALLCFTQAIWAQDETIDLTTKGYGNGETVESVSGTNCNITFGLGTNTHDVYPKFYTNGNAVRLYAGNTMTVTAKNSKAIAEINMVFGSGGNSNAISVDAGTYTDGTWTGDATEVTFTVGGKSGHRRVQQVQVTYRSTVAPPVISGTTPFSTSTQYSITAQEGATIRYTTDGKIPTSYSTIYTTPNTVSTTTTVKAIAIKDGVTSNVATMLFVKDIGLSGFGTKANPFLISSTGDLDKLATCVNGGDPLENTYFRVTADIDYAPESAWNDVTSMEHNFESIGINGIDFRGIFDGQNHTISGIRFYDPSKYMVGLFGKLASGAIVKNIILANSRITADDRTGGIVGHNESGTVENCHILADVLIHDKASSNLHGGIVGLNQLVIRGCTCAATLSIDDGKMATSYGGIAGKNQGQIINSLCEGVSLPDVSHFNNTSYGRYIGAMIGDHTNGTVTGNLYVNCSFGNTAATTGIGGSVSGIDALPALAFPIGTTAPSLRFDADEPNLDVVEAYPNVLVYQGTAYFAKDKQVTVTLNNRTLTKNGNWNTLCLPFDVTIADSPLAGDGVEAKVFDNTSSLSDAGVLTLKFSNAPATIAAGTPFIIKWNNIGSTITDPVFSGVTITSTSPTEVESTDHNVKFVGQYSPFSITSNNINEILFISSNNQIGYSRNPRTLKNFRAHFWVQPDASGSSSARAINVDWGDGEVSGIMTTNLTNDTNSVGAWYDLQGRKVTKPTKGLYIVNGRKVVIK